MNTKKSFIIMLLAWLMPVIALADDCTITFSQEGGYVNIDGNPNGISFNIGGGSSGYIIQNPRTFTCSSGSSFTLNIPANSSYVPSRLTINDTEITLVPEVGSSTSVSFTVPEESNVEVKLYWASIITTNYTSGNYRYSVLYNDASASPARRAVLKSYNGSDATVTSTANVTYSSNSYTVVAIAPSAFENNTSITAFTLPTTLRALGSNVFKGCTNLTTVSFSTSTYLKEIPSGAFYGCTKLNRTTSSTADMFIIPGSVTTVKGSAFTGCTSLKTVRFYTPMEFIAYNAFDNSDDLLFQIQPSGTNYTVNSYVFGKNTSCNYVHKLELMSSIKTLNNNAFTRCSSLSEVVMTGDVTSIGINAFPNALKTVTINKGSGSGMIESNLFKDVSQIKNLTIGEGMTQILAYAFQNCTNLTNVTLPSTLRTITAYAFAGCTNLTDIDIPEGVAQIYIQAFYDYTGVVTIPTTVTTINTQAFYNCSGIKVKWTTPPAATNLIDSDQFGANKGRNKTLYVPLGSKAAYQAADGWKEFTDIQEYLTDDTMITFADANVKAICVAPEQGWDTNGDGELSIAEAAAVTNEGLKNAFMFAGAAASITTFDELQYFTGLTMIPTSTFGDYTALQSVTLPPNITSIGNYAFRNCAALEDVVIPEGVTSIGSYAFQSYTGIVTLPSTITELMIYCFQNASGAKVSWTEPPADLTSQLYNAFGNISNKILYVPTGSCDIYEDSPTWRYFDIREYGIITFADSNVKAICVNKWDTDGDGELSAEEAAAANWWEFATDNGAFRNNTTITSFDELKSFIGLPFIAEGVFISCSNLTSIKLPRTITDIGMYSFYGCTSLTSINIPKSVTSIGQAAFSGCSSLTELTLPDGITTIGKQAFCNTALQRLNIPYSVTSMDDAFEGTTGNIPMYVSAQWNEPIAITENTFPNRAQATLYVPAGKEEAYRQAPYWQDFGTIIANIEFSDPAVKDICVAHWDTNGDGDLSTAEAAAVTDLGEIFKGNTEIANFNELKYFTGLTKIAGYAFSGCSALQYITLPENITRIVNGAFANCTSLTRIIIPNGVTLIFDYAFAGCTSLRTFTLPSSLTTVTAHMCDGCTSLRSITIPEGVQFYRDKAFVNCTNLREVTVKGSEPGTIDGDPFPTRTSITLIVPAHAGDAYSTAPYWEEFAPITEAEPEWTGIYTDENGDQYQYEVGYSAQLYHYNDNSSRTSFTIPSDITVDGTNYPVTTIYRRGLSSEFLETLTIPASVTTLKDEAISCITVKGTGFRLKDIYMRGSEPPTAGSYETWIHEIRDYNTLMEYQYPDDPSKQVSLKDITLHVPTGSLAAYQAADFWKEFTVVEYDWTGTLDEPFTVAQARALVNTSIPDTSDMVYVKGVVSKRNSSPNSNGTLTYWISDDGSQTDELNVYAGYNIDDAAFTGDDLDVGDIVVVYGNIRLRSNTYICGSESTLISRIKHGDVNGDNVVSTADVTALVNIILGKTTSYDFAVADINGDHHVTIADVTTLVNMILGK